MIIPYKIFFESGFYLMFLLNDDNFLQGMRKNIHTSWIVRQELRLAVHCPFPLKRLIVASVAVQLHPINTSMKKCPFWDKYSRVALVAR
ncbi:MAG TPA: hypothetical protein PKM63_22155 [Panacibacter sp.]|nr:hypothetical protein [Panacibacter sp.]HNP47018.1 hypothetical protein [Panacibacter sp.]